MQFKHFPNSLLLILCLSPFFSICIYLYISHFAWDRLSHLFRRKTDWRLFFIPFFFAVCLLLPAELANVDWLWHVFYVVVGRVDAELYIVCFFFGCVWNVKWCNSFWLVCDLKCLCLLSVNGIETKVQIVCLCNWCLMVSLEKSLRYEILTW